MGGLIHVVIFFAYSKQSEVAFCIMVLLKQEMLLGVLRVVRIQKARKFGMGFFGGLIFCSRGFFHWIIPVT